MVNDLSDEDKALFARLNAIKPSHVSIESSNSNTLAPLRSESEDTPEDLIARFQKIHGREIPQQEIDNSPQRLSVDGRPESPTVEELLADIGPEEQYTIDDSEMKEAQDLLSEAKAVLPTQKSKATVGIATTPATDDIERPPPPEPPKSEIDEDTEANTTLQRILDEVEQENEAEPQAPPPTRSDATPGLAPAVQPDSFASLQFPSIPDSAFDAFTMPSAPTTAPQAKAKARLSGATDEEIESWCIICCADASVQCFGCDKELYCWGCWREGHMGESAGPEQRGHVWERWSKQKANRGR